MESSITITAKVTTINARSYGMNGKAYSDEPADLIGLQWIDPRRGQYTEYSCNMIVPAGTFKTTDRIKIEVSKC